MNTEMFKPHRIELIDARAGDILVFKGRGLWFCVLGWLVKRLEPTWDGWGWHTAPVIGPDLILDAQFPRLRKATISGYLATGRRIRAYRIFPQPPAPEQIANFVLTHEGMPYDFLAYALTAASKLIPRFPRVIDWAFHCWETTWEFADECGYDISDTSKYPWICDLLRVVGEM